VARPLFLRTITFFKIEAVWPPNEGTQPTAIKMQHARSSFRETGALLGGGACGSVLATDQAGLVVKRIHRRLKHRAKCLDARAQCAMQQWCASLLTPSNGFSVLFSPQAWTTGSTERQYAMEQIDCSSELSPLAAAADPLSPEATELKLFYEKAQAAGIFPCDYELYRQPDGRIALIDFDKFSQFANGEVTLPWGATMRPVYPWPQ